MTSNIDERGRILIPREFREAHGLMPGSPVIIEDAPDGVIVRPALSKSDALARLAGSLKSPLHAKAPDPLAMKRLWEPRRG